MKSGLASFTALSVTLSVFYIILISIPNNIISTNYNFFKNSKLSAILPQGWAFFTRNPREDQITIYSQKGENIINVSLKTTNKSELFGIKRSNRFIQDKLGNIISEIDKKYWYNTQTDYDFRNIANALNHVSISVSYPSLCGTYIIEVKKIMPWSYFKSELSSNISLDTKLIKLTLICKN